jgi:hypothetical protein
MVLSSLEVVKPLLASTDDIIYTFLLAAAQNEVTIGTGAGFMANFDYKGLLENV